MGQSQDRKQQNQGNPGSGQQSGRNNKQGQQGQDRGQASPVQPDQRQQDQRSNKESQRGQESASDEILSDEDE